MNEALEIKKAVITGPTGAVGTALIDELISHGITVYAVCRPGSRRIKNIPSSTLVKIIECDLSRLSDLSSLINDECQAFFHFGWEGTYGEARDMALSQTRNIQYTLEAVEAAEKLHCSVFTGAGSQAEYGHVEGIIRPDTPCFPVTCYGAAKSAACTLSRILCRQKNIRHEWCRIISLYGPNDGDYTMVMSGILKMLKNEHASYTRGEQIWDYIYSKDAAKAFYLAASRGKDGAVYCLGSGQPRPLKDYILAIRNAIDPNVEIGIGEMDYYPNQVMHLCADITNLTEDTGYTPEYTFEEGIAETVEWTKARK